MNNKKLKSIIAESINQTLTEAKLKEDIKSMVRQYINEEINEKKSGKSTTKGKHKKGGSTKKSNKKKDEKSKDKFQNKVRQLKSYFDKPGVDNAQFAYKLDGIKPKKGKDTIAMKNSRSEFGKCKNGFVDRNGYQHGWTPKQVNRLVSMISNGRLAESKNINEITMSNIIGDKGYRCFVLTSFDDAQKIFDDDTTQLGVVRNEELFNFYSEEGKIIAFVGEKKFVGFQKDGSTGLCEIRDSEGRPYSQEEFEQETGITNEDLNRLNIGEVNESKYNNTLSEILTLPQDSLTNTEGDGWDGTGSLGKGYSVTCIKSVSQAKQYEWPVCHNKQLLKMYSTKGRILVFENGEKSFIALQQWNMPRFIEVRDESNQELSTEEFMDETGITQEQLLAISTGRYKC